MNLIELHAFRDELVKIAVTLNQLQTAYRRLPILRLKTQPSRVNINELMSMPNLSTPKAIARTMGMSATNPAAVRHAKKSLRDIPGYLRKQLPGLPEEHFREAVEQATAHAKDVAGGAQMAGRIMRPAGGAVRTIQRKGAIIPGITKTTRKLKPEAQRGVNLVTGMHEASEAGVQKLQPFAGHLHPDVMAQEHNLVTSLTGTGAKPTRKAMRKLRTLGPEAEGMRAMMEAAYGPRGAQFTYGKGPKITKAMRKDLKRRMGEIAQRQQEILMKRYGG